MAIRDKLREIAVSVVPYATALKVAANVREKVGNVSVMPRGAGSTATVTQLAKLILERVNAEGGRVSAALDSQAIEDLTVKEYERLSQAVAGDDHLWKIDLPGRVIFNKFAGYAGIQVGRLKQLYLARANKAEIFSDIIAIFEDFRMGR